MSDQHDSVPIHPNQIPDLVHRVQQLELENQRKNEIISTLRDNEAWLKARLGEAQVLIQAYEAVHGAIDG